MAIINTDLQTMQEAIEKLSALTNEYAEKFKQFSEEEFSAKPNPSKWSNKEIIGHLVDSAQNNIRRFIKGQYEMNPHIVYYQDEWVAIQNYQHYDTKTLVQLWALLNNHICIILKNMPEKMYGHTCNTGKGKEDLHTLEFLAKDYVDHHLHHLKQIIL